jgi:hypothetical protein
MKCICGREKSEVAYKCDRCIKLEEGWDKASFIQDEEEE